MTILSLDEIKAHLRLDGDTEDAHLQLLAEAAVDHAVDFLDRPLPWMDADGGPVAVPASIRAALLLIIGDLYENREGQITGTIRTDNPAVMRLLTPHRVGMGI